MTDPDEWPRFHEQGQELCQMVECVWQVEQRHLECSSQDSSKAKSFCLGNQQSEVSGDRLKLDT